MARKKASRGRSGWRPLTDDEVKKAAIPIGAAQLKRHARKGAKGFKKIGQIWHFKPKVALAWYEESGAGFPGPRAAAAKRAKSERPATGKKTKASEDDQDDEEEEGSETPLLDPKLAAEIEGLGKDEGGPLEGQLARCKRLFDRFSDLALTWSDERLLDPGDQKAFCDVVKVLNQLTSKITQMEGKLIEVRQKHGELIPIDSVRAMLRGLADDVIRGSEEMAGPMTSLFQSYFEEVAPGVFLDGDELRRIALTEIKRWRGELAQRHKPGASEAAA